MTYHVVPYTPPKGSKKERLGHKWAVKHEGSDRNSLTAPSKKYSIGRAKGMAARHTGKKVIVHNSKGRTQYALENTGTRKSPDWKRV